MKIELTEEEMAALVVLRSAGEDLVASAIIAKEAMEAGHGRIRRARRCIAAGVEALKKEKRTVSFERAVEAALEVRRERRVRTVYEFRYFTRRFMKRCPGLARRKIRAISALECAQYIEKSFDTPRQRQKARLILSGVFSTALKRGWCNENPVARVEVPRVVEKEVTILDQHEITTLQQAAASYKGGSCAAAVGMMLYAGIRPHEVARLSWAEVDLKEQAIYISPRHSKTGGARRVTIHKPLLKILRNHQQPSACPVCPPNWRLHWQKLRRYAGWDPDTHPWQQDVLRHTYASYHLSYFRSFAELQCEIGHRDSALLRTRYLDMRGVEKPACFWRV